MGAQTKKKARSFSFTDEEFETILERADYHAFKDRNEYIWALIEADRALRLEIELSAQKQRVLRPKPPTESAQDFVTRRLREEDKRSSEREAAAEEKRKANVKREARS